MGSRGMEKRGWLKVIEVPWELGLGGKHVRRTEQQRDGYQAGGAPKAALQKHRPSFPGLVLHDEAGGPRAAPFPRDSWSQALLNARSREGELECEELGDTRSLSPP